MRPSVFKILAYTWRKSKRCCFTGVNGVRKGIGHIFGDSFLHAHQKNIPIKTCRSKNDTGKRYKNRGCGRPLATTSSCSTVFLETVLQISRLHWNIHEHFSRPQPQTTLNPGYTTKLGISRGFEDKFWWRKLRPNHGVKTVRGCVRKRSSQCCFWVFGGHQTRGGNRVSVTFQQRNVL